MASYAISYIGLNAQKNFAHWQLETPAGDGHFDFHGMNAGIFGGYGCILDPNFYLGGEVFADFIPLNTSKETINNIVYQTKAKYGLGLRMIAGHYLYPATFIFVSLGVIDTAFEFEAVNNLNVKNNENENAFAIQYGFGIQSKIYQKLEGRLEYVYSNYQAFNSFGNKIFPQNNQINLGIIYRIH
jgi:hypothetical protein